MEKYQEAGENALRHIRVADHILTMTYPLAQDPKLLIFVLKRINKATDEASSSLLQYDRYQKRIPPYNENLTHMHLGDSFGFHGISRGYLGYISDLKEIVQRQNESDVEFVRKEKLVFASKDFDLNYVTEKQIKELLAKAKLYIQEILRVVGENGRDTRS